MKKALSLFLALIMIISIIPMSSITASAGTTLLWPVPGHKTLSQGYSSSHPGIDIADSSIGGADIVAAIGGTVTNVYKCTEKHYGSRGDCDGFGTGVIIRGTDGRWYQYAHMKAGSIPSNVTKGAKVVVGQKIGKVGSTGNSSGNHLHFQINTTDPWHGDVNAKNETYVDEIKYTLSIKYDANGGEIDTSHEKYYLNGSGVVCRKSNDKVFTQEIVDGTICESGLYNRTTFGLSKEGYTFVGWGTKSSGGTIYNQNDPMTAKTLCPTIGDGDQTITLYAIWEANTLSVYYNANGGEVTEENFSLNNGLIYKNNDKFVQSWAYNKAKDTGLFNPKSFGLKKTGYTFMGWGTKSSGGTVFDQNDTTLLPTDIKSGIKDGSCSRTLYAIWQAKTYTIAYDANGGSGTMSASSHTYDTAKALNANAFTRTGYTFLGWSTNPTATVAKYTDKQTVKNLTASNDATITLYAVWSQNVHTAGEWTVVTPATCTTVGSSRLNCTTCGEIIAEKEIPMTEHTAGVWETVEKETCTTDGLRQKKCTVCGEIIAIEEVSATGHTAGAWETTTEATCKTEGMKLQKCTVCGEVIDVEEIPTADHVNGEWLVIVEPTCEEAGVKVQDCYYCGEELKSEEIPATGHNYQTVVTAPTCTAQGYTTYTCSCGYSYVGDYVDAIGHNDNNDDGYCDSDNELLDPTKNCDCNCHKKGIANFFFKFALFFQKIFRANKTCGCGVAHY